MNISIGKAGRTRWLGWRRNRGVVMNPIDHPHGGSGTPRAARRDYSVRQTDQGQRRPFEQIDQQIHSPKPPQKAEEVRNAGHGSFSLERPVRRGSLLKKADAARAMTVTDVIKIWSRGSTILPQFIGLTFSVYSQACRCRSTKVVGHKFGEFSPTRTFHGHSGNKKAKRAGISDEQTKARTRPRVGPRTVARMLRGGPRSSIWWLADPQPEAGGARRSAVLAALSGNRDRRQKVPGSAIANAENNHDLEVDDLVIRRGPCRQRYRDEALCPRAVAVPGRNL